MRNISDIAPTLEMLTKEIELYPTNSQGYSNYKMFRAKAIIDDKIDVSYFQSYDERVRAVLLEIHKNETFK